MHTNVIALPWDTLEVVHTAHASKSRGATHPVCLAFVTAHEAPALRPVTLACASKPVSASRQTADPGTAEPLGAALSCQHAGRCLQQMLVTREQRREKHAAQAADAGRGATPPGAATASTSEAGDADPGPSKQVTVVYCKLDYRKVLEGMQLRMQGLRAGLKEQGQIKCAPRLLGMYFVVVSCWGC